MVWILDSEEPDILKAWDGEAEETTITLWILEGVGLFLKDLSREALSQIPLHVLNALIYSFFISRKCTYFSLRTKS